MNAVIENREPTPDELITVAVRALMVARHVKAEQVAEVIGSSRGPVFAKFRGSSPWKAAEVAALADYFGVPVGNLFNGLGLLSNNAEAPRPEGRGASRSVRLEGFEPPTF